MIYDISIKEFFKVVHEVFKTKLPGAEPQPWTAARPVPDYVNCTGSQLNTE